jgi:hypothetical protein
MASHEGGSVYRIVSQWTDGLTDRTDCYYEQENYFCSMTGTVSLLYDHKVCWVLLNCFGLPIFYSGG